MIAKIFKNKKILILSGIVFVFILTLVLSIVAAVNITSIREVAPPNGGTAKSIARSYTDDGWFVGDSKGNVSHMNAEGEKVADFRVPSESGISLVYTDRDLDYVLVVDEALNLYAVSFNGEPELVTQGSLSGGCYGVTADEENVYVVTSRSRYTALRKFPKDDFSSSTGQGLLYSSTYLPTSRTYSLTPVFNASVILFEAIEDTLYLFTEGGVGFRIANDFSMNAFDWMSDEELENYGASIGRDGTVTVPEEHFLPERYNNSNFSYATYSAVYDRDTQRFYVGYANNRLYAVDTDLNELSYVGLKDAPGLSMFYHEKSKQLFFNYKLLSDVGVCEIDGDEFSIVDCFGNFDISSMITDGAGNNVYYLYTDTIANTTDSSAKILKTCEISGWKTRGVTIGLTIAGFIVSVLAAISAAIFVIFTTRKGVVEHAKAVCKKVSKNWGVYLIVFASLATLILFTYYPGFSSLFLSFFNYTKTRPTLQWNNFANYAAVFTNPYVGVYFRNLAIFLFADVFLALLPPIIFAVCLVFIRNKKYSTLCRVLLYIPGVIPGIASTLIWTSGIYGLDGLLNGIITAFGGDPIVFLQEQNMSVFWLLMMGFPFVGSYLIFFGGLMNVPTSYYEAAELDGCPIFKRIFLIDVPLITPQLKYVFVMTFISSVQNFTRVRLTTDGLYGSQVIMNVLYNYLSEGEYGISAAYGAIMFVILMVATLINLRLKTVDAEG